MGNGGGNYVAPTFQIAGLDFMCVNSVIFCQVFCPCSAVFSHGVADLLPLSAFLDAFR